MRPPPRKKGRRSRRAAVGERVYLSLGSNLGDREGNLRRTCEALSSFLRDLRLSPIYRTDPLYVVDQPPFLNAAVEGAVDLAPQDLLGRIHAVEAEMGRDRSRETRRGPRTLDIDILLYGALVLESPELTIPHPRLLERAFALVPLLDLAPEIMDPRTGRPLRAALEAVGRRGVYLYHGG